MKKLIAVFVALLLLGVVATGVAAQSGGAGFYDFDTSVRMWQNLKVYGTAAISGDITASDDLTVTDQLVVDGDVTVGDDVTVVDLLAVGKLRATKGTTQTITASGEITSVATFQPISAAGNIGTSAIAAGAAPGSLLIIENIANVSIVLTDTGTTMLTGNLTLGQYDTVALIWDGTNWVQLTTSNN
jgi:acyl-[acyl carrier protein]--UDP-N-acetylglucosamine O-acyltransferase